MSAAQTQKEGGEACWGALEGLGLSQKELVLAEALQMEYDALSRLKQDSGGPPNEQPRSTPSLPAHTEVTRPEPSQIRPDGPQHDPLLEDRAREPMYILNSSDLSKSGDPPESAFLPSSLLPVPELTPPAIPPRIPLGKNPPTPPRGPAPPRDVNLFTPEKDPPKVTTDIINHSLSHNNAEQSGKPVGRSQTLPPQIPPRTYLQVNKSNRNQRRASTDPVSHRVNGFGYQLFQVSEERDEEVAAFCHMLDILRSAFPHNDPTTNSGLIWAAGGDEGQQGVHSPVRVSVVSEHFREPLTFTCDGSSTVDLLIYQTLCYAQDDLDHVDVNQYLLKVCGHDKFLHNSQTLGTLEFVQQCLKFDCDVQLFLTKRSSVIRELSRTEDDDATASTMNHNILLQERPIRQTVTREALTLLLDTFYTEAESFMLSETELPLHVERLVQSVKALCSSLAAVETPEVTSALSQLPACPCRVQPKVLKDASLLLLRENREKVVERLTAAILDLVELYCNTFNANFHTTMQNHCSAASVQEAGLVTSLLSFNVYAAHRVPVTWAASYEGYFLSCSLTHGGVELCAPQHTSKQLVSKYLFHLVVWDQR